MLLNPITAVISMPPALLRVAVQDMAALSRIRCVICKKENGMHHLNRQHQIQTKSATDK